VIIRRRTIFGDLSPAASVIADPDTGNPVDAMTGKPATPEQIAAATASEAPASGMAADGSGAAPSTPGEDLTGPDSAAMNTAAADAGAYVGDQIQTMIAPGDASGLPAPYGTAAVTLASFSCPLPPLSMVVGATIFGLVGRRSPGWAAIGASLGYFFPLLG